MQSCMEGWQAILFFSGVLFRRPAQVRPTLGIAGTIYSLSTDDLFNNLFSNVFNNLFQNSQSVEILKQSRYVGADGKKNKFFFHSHDYQVATGLPENSHILELSNRLLNRLLDIE